LNDLLLVLNELASYVFISALVSIVSLNAVAFDCYSSGISHTSDIDECTNQIWEYEIKVKNRHVKGESMKSVLDTYYLPTKVSV